MITDTRALASLAERAARAAGALLLEHAAGPVEGLASKSSDTDMVSAADRAAEDLLRALITGARPEDGILGEEGTASDGTSGLRWVVDPLDGTTNFLYRLPQWAVSVAVEDREGALAGCVYDPNRDECYVASRGNGATLNGRAMRVSTVTDLGQALVGTGFGYEAGLRRAQALRLESVLPAVRDIRRGGSAALDLVSVACGRLDGFFESGIMHWDWAAGRLCVTEAGGAFALVDGPHGLPHVVATNGPLQATLVALTA